MSSIVQRLEKGKTYHIFNQGNNKECIFNSEENRRYFLELFTEYALPICDIYAYCLLKNHFHFLLRVRENSVIENRNLHLPFSHFFNSYAQAFNKEQCRSGSLFRTRFKRTLIKDEKHFIDALLYIHLNPIKHGFSNDIMNFSWSSYHSFFNESNNWLDKQYVLSRVGGKENFTQIHLKRQAEIIGMKRFVDWIEDT